MLDVRLAGSTHPGARDHNEDALRHGALPQGWFAVLADGAGGHSHGEVASDLAVRMASRELLSQAHAGPLTAAALSGIVQSAHEAINRQQHGAHGRGRMHATLVLLWVSNDAAHGLQARWAHVGDSRLYLLRQGRVLHVTRDDSVMQDMVDAGLLTAEAARKHPQRHQLSAALGGEEPVAPHVSPTPWTLRDGDAFLICSDGWHELLERHEIEASLAEATDPDAWLADMQHRVLAHEAPRQDNLSAIAVWIGNPTEVTRIAAG